MQKTVHTKYIFVLLSKLNLYCIRSITPKPVTSLRGPFLHYCTCRQHSSFQLNIPAMASRWQHCVTVLNIFFTIQHFTTDKFSIFFNLSVRTLDQVRQKFEINFFFSYMAVFFLYKIDAVTVVCSLTTNKLYEA